MPYLPERRAINGRCRKPVRHAPINQRWLHLHSGSVSNQQTLQTCTVWVMATSTYYTLLAALDLCLQGTALDSDAVKALGENASVVATSYCSAPHILTNWDHIFHNIPDTFKPIQHSTIDGLFDPRAKAMPDFTHGQFRQLFSRFDLEDCFAARKVVTPLPTVHMHQWDVACWRLVPPEEAFLFLLANVCG